MAHNYGEVYVGCGERKDGRGDVIVIPPAGEREDVRTVQADLDFMQAIEIAGQLRECMKEFPQALDCSADELLVLAIRLREAIKRAGPRVAGGADPRGQDVASRGTSA